MKKVPVFGVSSSKHSLIQSGEYERQGDGLLQGFQANGLGIKDFHASSGWLHKFKVRHGIAA